METQKERLDKFTRAAMLSLRSQFMANWSIDEKMEYAMPQPLALEKAAERCVEIAQALITAVDVAVKRNNKGPKS